MIVTFLHSASSATLVVVSDWLSIISRIRCSSEEGSPGAMLLDKCRMLFKNHSQSRNHVVQGEEGKSGIDVAITFNLQGQGPTHVMP